jgi:hypothetical protein
MYMYRKGSFILVALVVAFLFGCGGGGGSSSKSTDPTKSTNPSDPPANVAPIANAGTAQTVTVGGSATLDGTGSSDPDGNYPLTYAWQMVSKPADSQATLSDPASISPSFTADKAGDYTIQLVVTDSLGLASDPAVVVVSTVNSAPVADAGPDQTLDSAGATVQLDGTQSYDVDGDPITYAWSITTKPAGSTATLSDPTAATPTFVADLVGQYIAQLQVFDDKGGVSTPDEVQVNFGNVQPVANAGGNQTVVVGDTVYLDGSASFDANMDALTYSWAIVSAPAGSLAQLSSPTTVTPTFVPDVEGTYVLSLVVNDGSLDSLPSTVSVLAIAGTHVDDFVQKLMDAISAINALDATDFGNTNMRKALTNQIDAAMELYLAGDYSTAYDKLTGDVVGKMDGCAVSGDVDANDWIINCEAQAKVYPYVQEAISILETLLTT